MKLRNTHANSSPELTLGSRGEAIIKQLLVLEEPTSPRSVVSKEYVDARVNATSGAPGSIILLPTKTTPDGYLKCNGSAVPRTSYSALYTVIGDTFSSFPVKGSGQPWRHQYGINTTLDDISGKTWYKAANIPATNAYSQVIVTKNRVYMLSRYSGTAYTATVYTTTIDANGVLGTWTTASVTIPQALSYSQAIVLNNYVYLIGGYNGAYRANIYRAVINTDGTIGNFVSYASLPVTISHSQALITKGRIFLVGGYVGGVVSNRVYTALIDVNGNIGSWSQAASLPIPSHSHCATVIRDRIYVIGGTNNTGPSKDIYYADINADGTIDGWMEDFSLPETIHSSSLVCSRNRVYLFGGMVKGVASTAIHTAAINPDGTLAAWNIMSYLPETSYGTVSLVTASSVYILGGYLNSVIGNRINTIDYPGGLNDYSAYYGIETSELPNGMFRLPDYTFLEPYRLYAYMKY